MKSFLLFILLLGLLCMTCKAQFYTGPIPKPTTGYGAEGTYTVAIKSYPNPNFPTEDIRIYYPSGIASSVPTIFYSHGFGGNDPMNIIGLLNFVARKGYAIVFVPYQTTGVTSAQRYQNLLNGFLKSARDYPAIIDTTRVGFMGHSFGGGATFANAYHCFTQLNWGTAGRFMFTSAQWYSLNISQNELLNFPNNVKLISMVYENDSTNDHRITNDLFNTISIPSSEKDYLRVKSDTINSYTYDAIHGVPNTASAFDALDYYALYRHLDALCDYTFNGNLTAKDVALGNGSLNQVTMPGGLHNLVHSDAPNFSHTQNSYTYPCSAIQNPRSVYCKDAPSNAQTPNPHNFLIYPNPTYQLLNIEADIDISKVEFYNIKGELVKTATSKQISMLDLPTGLYLVEISFNEQNVKILKVFKAE